MQCIFPIFEHSLQKNAHYRMNRTYLLLIVFAVMAVFSACKKTYKKEVTPSAMLAISNSNIVELVNIIAAPDGGFVVGANTWKNGNKDFWILKYNDKFEVQWERVLGGANDETLQKLLVDKDNHVLAAGVSNGFGQDNTLPSLNKKSVLYFHYIDPNGNTKWETNYPYSNFNNFGPLTSLQKISDIIQDTDGDFVFTCQRTHIDASNAVGLVAILSKLSQNGNFTKSYFSAVSNPEFNWPAVFQTGNSYSVFWNGQFPYKAGFYEILSDSISTQKLKKSTLWNWGDEPRPPDLINELKLRINDNLLSYNYFFKNEVYRYMYDLNLKTVSGNTIPLGVDKLQSVSCSFDNHFLLASKSGTFYEMDADFKTVNTFETNLILKSFCKLIGGEYVFGIQQDDATLFLAHYNQKGKLEKPN